MSLGIYGTKKLADITADDIDIFFAYAANRNDATNLNFTPLFNNPSDSDLRKMFGVDGAYKLRLPADKFNKLGIYTIVIKPKSFETTILDCSYIVINNRTNINISKRGIVIPNLKFQSSGSLIGYQIEYFDKNNSNTKVKNNTKIITSSELVSAAQNSNIGSSSSSGYALDPNGSNLFITLSPDQNSMISNLSPVDLGSKGQKIILSNTFMDPLMIEVEMVDQNIKTLSYGIFGNSTRDNLTGDLSFFDDNGNIYKQYNLRQIKSEFTNGVVDIKEEKKNIDMNQNFTKISQGLI